jgi:hypothetical protein
MYFGRVLFSYIFVYVSGRAILLLKYEHVDMEENLICEFANLPPEKIHAPLLALYAIRSYIITSSEMILAPLNTMLAPPGFCHTEVMSPSRVFLFFSNDAL